MEFASFFTLYISSKVTRCLYLRPFIYLLFEIIYPLVECAYELIFVCPLAVPIWFYIYIYITYSSCIYICYSNSRWCPPFLPLTRYRRHHRIIRYLSWENLLPPRRPVSTRFWRQIHSTENPAGLASKHVVLHTGKTYISKQTSSP